MLSLFRDRRISLASLNLVLTGFSTYGVAVYLPLFMQGASACRPANRPLSLRLTFSPLWLVIWLAGTFFPGPGSITFGRSSGRDSGQLACSCCAE